MKKGDVVLIIYPFTDLSSTKVRPALVISNDNYNTKQSDIVLLLITSNISRLTSDDYVLDTNNPDRVGKIQTLNKMLLNSKLGTVGLNTIKEIEGRLRNLLEL